MNNDPEWAEAEARMNAFCDWIRKSKRIGCFIMIGTPEGRNSAAFNYPPQDIRRILRDAADQIPSAYREKGEPS